MKKSLLRAAALALALIFASLASACGKKGENDRIAGKWTAPMELKSAIEAELAESGEALPKMDFSGIRAALILEFRQDGTYSACLDKAGLNAAIEEMVGRMIPAVKEAFRTELASAEGKQPDEIGEEELALYLGALNIGSWDEFADALAARINPDELAKRADRTGRFLLKDGRLYMSASTNEQPGEGGEYCLCELTENGLLLKAPGEASAAPAMFGDMLPVTFVRPAENEG